MCVIKIHNFPNSLRQTRKKKCPAKKERLTNFYNQQIINKTKDNHQQHKICRSAVSIITFIMHYDTDPDEERRWIERNRHRPTNNTWHSDKCNRIQFFLFSSFESILQLIEDQNCIHVILCMSVVLPKYLTKKNDDEEKRNSCHITVGHPSLITDSPHDEYSVWSGIRTHL